MGYCKHNAILVTDWDDKRLRKMHKKAVKIFEGKLVTPIIPSVSNGYGTFVIVPDGSKEGWETSNEYEYDEKRQEFFVYLSDKSYFPDVVELWYDESGESGIVRGL